MKSKLVCLGVILILTTRISVSQEVRLRSVNDVVFGFYIPWDEEKLNSKIPAQLLHEDIDLFIKTIEEVGVNPYFNFPKDSFYHEISALKRKIDKPLTRREFLQQFVPVVNDLKLSHTHIKTDFWFDKKYYNKNGGTSFPVNIRIENDRLYIDKNFSSSYLPEGEEIISLNNIQSKILIDSLLRYSNGSTLNSKLMDVQDNFSLWLWWVYNFSGTFKIETRKTVYSVNGLTSAELENSGSKSSKLQTHKEYH